jgi:hypothetical protein
MVPVYSKALVILLVVNKYYYSLSYIFIYSLFCYEYLILRNILTPGSKIILRMHSLGLEAYRGA